jgi:GAF domain-containing protein
MSDDPGGMADGGDIADEEIARVHALIAMEPASVRDGATAPTSDRVPAGAPGRLHRLCRAAARALPASGVGVSVMTDAGEQGLAAFSDENSELLEELQFTLGEGPCVDAFAFRRPVLTPELDLAVTTRWPAYTPVAYERGVRAVFAFPMQIGGARLGVMDVYRDSPGALEGPALTQAFAFTEVALTTLLDQQDGSREGDTAAVAGMAMDHRAELFQAQGMVMVQLGVNLAEAVVRLRAYAYAQDQPLRDVAREVVARSLTFEPDRPHHHPPHQSDDT